MSTNTYSLLIAGWQQSRHAIRHPAARAAAASRGHRVLREFRSAGNDADSGDHSQPERAQSAR
ncbi:MAG TPA: hypothetical protein VK162_16890, partial [Streptosporangiaceae bacterium]|nr:hypothetical protein [Streptosporangiaceae bacterium]